MKDNLNIGLLITMTALNVIDLFIESKVLSAAIILISVTLIYRLVKGMK